MKRWIAGGLCAILLFLFELVPCAEEIPYVRLTMPFFFATKIPDDMDRIESALNEMTRKKIGVEVDLVPLLSLSGSRPDMRRKAELTLLEREGVVYSLLNDAFPNYHQFSIPLDELLETYGQGIIAAVGETRLNDCRVDGVLYELPSVTDFVSSYGISMRKDIVEKYAIDLSSIHSLKDLTPIFELVHQNEPNLGIVCGFKTDSGLLHLERQSKLLLNSVYCLDDQVPDQLVNYYTTDTFQTQVELIGQWAQCGYLYRSMSLQSINAWELVRSGELFSFMTAWKPGIEWETSLSCGCEMVTVPLIQPIRSQYSNSKRRWNISVYCPTPEKAMQFLNLLYTDSDVANLLLYGIEGRHYEFCSDGTIDYPAGMDDHNVGYDNRLPWLMPNQLISHVWHGYDPDMWRQLDTYNQSALSSPLLGFTVDDTRFAAENKALLSIADQYFMGLTCGYLDPNRYLPQMQAEMEQAGDAEVRSAIQQQYDQWRTGKGERE